MNTQIDYQSDELYCENCDTSYFKSELPNQLTNCNECFGKLITPAIHRSIKIYPKIGDVRLLSSVKSPPKATPEEGTNLVILFHELTLINLELDVLNLKTRLLTDPQTAQLLSAAVLIQTVIDSIDESLPKNGNSYE